jgi:hypothetical protein
LRPTPIDLIDIGGHVAALLENPMSSSISRRPKNSLSPNGKTQANPMLNSAAKVKRISRRSAFILASAKKKNYFIVARI